MKLRLLHFDVVMVVEVVEFVGVDLLFGLLVEHEWLDGLVEVCSVRFAHLFIISSCTHQVLELGAFYASFESDNKIWHI